MTKILNYYGNNNIGLFCCCNDKYIFVPEDSEEKFCKALEEELKAEIIKTRVYDTNFLGIFIALNNNGMVLPSCIDEEELRVFKKLDMNVEIIHDKHNALGNLILVNDKGAIVSPLISRRNIKKIEDALDCEVHVLNIEEFKIIGSCGIANNKGCIINPNIKEEYVKEIESVLKVRVDYGTVNRGVGFVKSGALTNNKGLIVGEETTGVEIVRLEEVLLR